MTTEVFEAMWDAPLSQRGWIAFNTNTGAVKMRGLDHKALTLVGQENVPGLGTVLTLHEKGGTHWVGRGIARAVDPASIHTILLGPVGKAEPNVFRYVRLTNTVVPGNQAERTDHSTLAVNRLLGQL